MTNLALPSQGAMQAAPSAVTGAPFGERNTAGSSDSQDGSAFDAVLGALSDGGAPTEAHGAGSAAAQPPSQSGDDVTPTIASWRSVSKLHHVGSGVLLALDKRFSSTTSADQQSITAKARADAETGANAATLAGIGWTSLIASPTDATVAQAEASSAAGATITDATPSGSPPTIATTAGATSAATSPVEVKVVRSITYLGLDPTARNVQLAAVAPARPAAKNSPETLAVQGARGDQAQNALLSGPSASSTPASGDQTQANSHGASADERASGKTDRTEQEAPSNVGQAKPAALSGAAQTTVGATSPNNLSLVPIDQLADVVASAAEDLGSQTAAAASSGTTAASAYAARAPIKELDVQLNPASLGALSIQMRLTNGNLSVTIKADKSDTLKLIDNERGAIADKLKSLNFSVDSLVVKASDPAAASTAGADASNTGTSGYGEAQQGQAGQNADGSRDGRLQQGAGDQRQSARQGAPSTGDAGDGNFGHRVV